MEGGREREREEREPVIVVDQDRELDAARVGEERERACCYGKGREREVVVATEIESWLLLELARGRRWVALNLCSPRPCVYVFFCIILAPSFVSSVFSLPFFFFCSRYFPPFFSLRDIPFCVT